MKAIVISLGGSIIVPKEVDYRFLKDFKKTILSIKNRKIVICTGGGFTARDYISALKKEKLNEYTLDLMGIEATRLNAKLLASFLQKCNQEIPITLESVKELLNTHNLVVCGGLSSGQTSDGTTAQIADYLDADEMINITNVDGLYDKDPKKYKNAKFIPKLTHKEFMKIISKVKKVPGQHFVLDSLAAEIALKAGIKVIILKGMKNLKNHITGKKFKGTVIG